MVRKDYSTKITIASKHKQLDITKKFGFQPGKSCIDVAVNLVEEIEAAFQQNKYVLVNISCYFMTKYGV